MLLANNIFFSRNNKKILSNINISLGPKKIIHLIGDNGVGKTTLLKILSNILIPQRGDIFWNGKNIKKNPFEYYNNITFIMDKQTCNNNLTVYENIFFWKKVFSSNIKKKEIDLALDLLSLNNYQNTNTSLLSYGEIKKLEFLRLIIEQKKLWILDEPYVGLDSKSIEIIDQTITNHIKLDGMAIIASHIMPNLSNLEKINLENNENY